MLKWIVFGVVWGFGLFLADLIHAAGNFANTSQIVMFGGLWMLQCSGIRDFIEGYQSAKQEAG